MAATMASVSEADGASEPYSGPTERIDAFLRSGGRETPFLVVDLDVVAARYRQLAESLPGVDVFFAVKANPAPEILEMLVRLGAHFDVASTGEIDACLAAGADPSTLSFGNTVKKRTAIRDAYVRGVRLFAFDSDEELDKLIDLAPGATVFCRMLCNGSGADWPLSRKFGCDPDVALALLVARRACRPRRRHVVPRRIAATRPLGLGSGARPRRRPVRGAARGRGRAGRGQHRRRLPGPLRR